MSYVLLTLMFTPIILGVLIYAFDQVSFSRTIFVLQAVLSFLVGNLVYERWLDQWGSVSVVAGGWPTIIGVELKVDSLTVLFLSMTVLAFWFAYIYVWETRKNDHKFLFFLSNLQGALLALFMLNDIFSIFVLIELITLTSTILITYKRDGASVEAGLIYLLYNSLGMLLYLMGIIFIYQLVGTLNITEISKHIESVKDINTYRWSLVMLTAFLCIKLASFPVGGWLPLAHGSAPASISALLSGLIVKTGVFSLLRLGIIFPDEVRTTTLLIIGMISGIVGAALAVMQTDIKKMLAYSTISQVGLILIGLCGLGMTSVQGGILHTFNHFLFKSLLFLCAGVLITATGHRKFSELKGVLKNNPVLGTCFIVGILNITGAPFFTGSISKELIKIGDYTIKISYWVNLINFGTLLSFSKFIPLYWVKEKRKIFTPTMKIYAPIVCSMVLLVAYPIETLFFSIYIPGTTIGTHLIKQVVNIPIYLLWLMVAYGVYHKGILPWLEKVTSTKIPLFTFDRGVGFLTVLLSVLALLLL